MGKSWPSIASAMSATRISEGPFAIRHPPPAPRKLLTRPALCRAPSCCSRNRRGICCATAISRAGTRASSSCRFASSIIARIAYSSFWEILSTPASPANVGSAYESVNAGNAVKRLPEDRPSIPELRCVYADLDGTLLGPGGSLFAAPGGGVTDRAAEALRRLHLAGVRLVLMSGRTRRGLAEVARVLGGDTYIAELGALIVERHEAGETVIPNPGTPSHAASIRAIVRSGAGALLLERFPRRLRPVAPWSEVTLMLQGWVEPDEANAALRSAGYGWLELQDNGRMRRTVPGLEVDEVHALHLLPKGIDKASAVALDRERHAVPAACAIAVGDSRSDLRVAAEVGAFFLVANGLPSLEGASLPDNVWVTGSAHGDGFAEAIEASLPR